MIAAHAGSVRSVAVILSRAKDRVEVDAQSYALETAESLARGGLIPEMLEQVRKYRRNQAGDVPPRP